MRIMDLMVVLEKIAPLGLQMTEYGGDNCGLIIGREEAEVKRVMVSLDLTKRVVETSKIPILPR